MLFALFALTLICIAVFNKKAFLISLAGFIIILIYTLLTDRSFDLREHFLGNAPLAEQLINKHLREGEWHILLNLLGLLLGFEILSKLFQETRIPELMPKYLPDDWKGPFVLLLFVFILSSFLDNIAAALIGGAVAAIVFKGRVHMGYLVSIVAAANAGGAGSVLGDTTTTMMWLNGISPLNVLHAYIAAVVAFLIFGIIGSHQQHKYQQIIKDAPTDIKLDVRKIIIVIMILAGAIISNVLIDLPFAGVWLALIIGSTFSRIPWKEASIALKGALFLIFLVSAASLMPVKSLPVPTWQSTLSFGFISSVFDNIPLTKLCLDQGGYDWGILAYAVGFGGSMMWFGSSAGVAITNEFPEARNAWLWIKSGWYVILAYIIGFFALLLALGWNPN